MKLATVTTVHIGKHIHDGFAGASGFKDNHIPGISAGKYLLSHSVEAQISNIDELPGTNLVQAAIKEIIAVGRDI